LDFNVGTGTIFVEDSGMSGTLDGNRDRLFYVFKGSSNEQIKYKELSGNGEGMVYNCENSCFSLSWVNGKLLFVDKSISDGTSKIMVAWEENGNWQSRLLKQDEDIMGVGMDWDGEYPLYRKKLGKDDYELWLMRTGETGNPILVDGGNIIQFSWKPQK